MDGQARKRAPSGGRQARRRGACLPCLPTGRRQTGIRKPCLAKRKPPHWIRHNSSSQIESFRCWIGNKKPKFKVRSGPSSKAGASLAQITGQFERVKGIEPSYPDWQPGVLPLYYTRLLSPQATFGACLPVGRGKPTRSRVGETFAEVSANSPPKQ